MSSAPDATAPLALEAYMAQRSDRCAHGFAPAHHPAFCGCDDAEWHVFTRALRAAARDDGTVHQCDVRPRIRGRIEPKHIGLLWRRARSSGLIREAGHERSDDTTGRNAGRMEPFYRLVLSPSAAATP